MTPLVVLVVDDNDLLLSLVGRILDTAGIAALQAGSAADALRLWRDSPVPIDMLITDVEMPGQSGFALADKLTRDRPDLPVLFMSGSYRDDPRLRPPWPRLRLPRKAIHRAVANRRSFRARSPAHPPRVLFGRL